MDIRFMYNLLTRMPLLQGIGGMDLARLEERARLEVEEHPASGASLIRQGQPCRELVFLVSGELRRTTESADHVFVTEECLTGPAVIEPDKLFGLSCEYASSYHSETDCQLMTVKKLDVTLHLMRNDIFRTNYINLLSAELGRKSDALQPSKQFTPEAKLRRFVLGRFSRTDGRKVMRIKMRDLAEYIGETRLTVSEVLNRWSRDGLIGLRRKEIIINDITKFGNEE